MFSTAGDIMNEISYKNCVNSRKYLSLRGGRSLVGDVGDAVAEAEAVAGWVAKVGELELLLERLLLAPLLPYLVLNVLVEVELGEVEGGFVCCLLREVPEDGVEDAVEHALAEAGAVDVPLGVDSVDGAVDEGETT